jgi:uncharacterized protein (TIGR02599 family)
MSSRSAKSRRGAFTLVELLLSTAVLSLIVLMLVAMTNQTAATWRYTTGKIEQFSGARDGFESLTRQIGQATLNTYYDYYNASGEPRTTDNAGIFVPKSYGRQSELRFISGSMDRSNSYNGQPFPALAADASRPRPTHGVFFHAPLGLVEDVPKHGGLQGLLNSWGYYVEFDSDERNRPAFLQGASTIAPPRWRYRLMEFMQPSEKMETYKAPGNWFAGAVNQPGTPSAHVRAENVLALVIQPALSPKDERALTPPPTVPGTALAPSYSYDSTQKNPTPALNPHHQLPPTVRVTMVSVDEPSAIRLANGSTMPDLGLENLFRTDTPKSAESYDQDLATLEATLSQKRASYRVFTTTVIIRGAKWSKQ